MTEDIKKLQDEVAFLKGEVERLKDELVRMVSRNLDHVSVMQTCRTTDN